jgi:hypothetical protein
MKIRPLARTAAVAALCATVAGAAGIAGSSAANKPSKTKKSTDTGQTAGPLVFMRGGPPVHSEEVTLNDAGTAYITRTEDDGVVVSATGDQLVITEGTKALPYKTVTLTIPSGATIQRNGTTAALSDFVAGDRVHVSQSSDGTEVFGGDKAMLIHGHHGPGGPDGPGDLPAPPPDGAPPVGATATQIG